MLGYGLHMATQNTTHALLHGRNVLHKVNDLWFCLGGVLLTSRLSGYLPTRCYLTKRLPLTLFWTGTLFLSYLIDWHDSLSPVRHLPSLPISYLLSHLLTSRSPLPSSSPNNQTGFNEWALGAVYYTLVIAEAFGKTNTSQTIELRANENNQDTPSLNAATFPRSRCSNILMIRVRRMI